MRRLTIAARAIRRISPSRPEMMRIDATLIGILIGLGLMISSGCATGGYRFGSTHDRSIRTIHIPIFENTTQHEGLQAELTEAIIKKIQRDTPYRVTSRLEADSVLSGTITSSRFRQLSRTRQTGLSQELTYELTVDFDWIDSGSGEPIERRRALSAIATFVPDRRVGERRAVGEQGVIDELASLIVEQLEASW